MTTLPGLADKIRNFDHANIEADLDSGEQERRVVLERFPLDQWARLPLDSYALGLGGSVSTYCHLMEYGTLNLGSIKGGAAAKHIMYRKHDGTWHLPARLGNIEPAAAWERLRAQFVRAFETVSASGGDPRALDELDTLDLLSYGPALTTKSLATYFPDEFLPIYSYDHLSHFIKLFQADVPSGPAWVLNRRLRDLISECELLDGWRPGEVMRLLYAQYDPAEFKNTTILKVAPGEGARWWHECLDGGFIAVGWDEVGDLTGYESDTALQAALAETWPVKAGGHVVKARQLLAYRDLKAGDLIVANQGKSKVLGVGKVTTGYRFDQSRAEGQHLVGVDWDTSYEQTLPAPEGA